MNVIRWYNKRKIFEMAQNNKELKVIKKITKSRERKNKRIDAQ